VTEWGAAKNYLKLRAFPATRRGLYRGWSHDTTVSCWTGVPHEAWVMVPVDARGLGGSPGKVGYRLAWRRMAGWLTGTDRRVRRSGLESPRAARVRNRTAVLGGEASTDMSPDQLGATRRGGSATQKVAMELESPRVRVLVSLPGRVQGLDGHTA
jgi:hypothetical protein